MTTKLANFGCSLRNVALAGAVVAVAVGSVAAPAVAFPSHGGYGREYRHDRDWHRHWAPPAYGYAPYGYGYGYAPAYAPAPIIGLTGLDFFFPIHIR
jgi:hypothetical protein